MAHIRTQPNVQIHLPNYLILVGLGCQGNVQPGRMPSDTVLGSTVGTRPGRHLSPELTGTLLSKQRTPPELF